MQRISSTWKATVPDITVRSDLAQRFPTRRMEESSEGPKAEGLLKIGERSSYALAFRLLGIACFTGWWVGAREA